MRAFTILCACVLLPLAAWAQYPSELVGFNDDVDVETSWEMFRIPQISGSTDQYIVANTSGSYANNNAYRASGVGVTEDVGALKVFFNWVDPNDTQAWCRLTTSGAAVRPNPSLHTEGLVRMKVTNPGEGIMGWGKVGFCIGIRESGVEVPQLYNGGGAGTIEWAGVNTSTVTMIRAGINGVIDSTLGGDDVIVDLDTGPAEALVVSWGDNRVFETTKLGGSDDIEVRGAYAKPDGEVGPIPAVTLDIAFFSVQLEWDLTTGVVSKDGVPVPNSGIAGMTGDDDISVTPPRGVFEHIAITNVLDPPGAPIAYREIWVDEFQVEAPDPDPVLPPSVVPPIIRDDTSVTVTDIQIGVDRVELFKNGSFLVGQDIVDPNDVVFTIAAAVADDYYQARQRRAVDALWSALSDPVYVFPEPSPYQFAILIDENGNDCSYTDGGGWEWVPVSTTSGSFIPHGMNLFMDSAVWQTIDVPFTDNDLVLPGLGGNGSLEPSPDDTHLWAVDNITFTIAEGAELSGPHEVLIDAVYALDDLGQVIKRVHTMESSITYFTQPRGQSTESPTTAARINTASYDGAYCHRLGWDYGTLDANQTLIMLNRIGVTCATGPTFPDSTATLRFRLCCREPAVAPAIALPSIVGPACGAQTAVRVNCDATATAVQLYVNGEAEGSPVDPGGATSVDFTSLTLGADDSVSATQTLPAGTSDLAYPRGVAASALPPALQTSILPGATTVTVNDCYTAVYATASAINVYVNDDPIPHGTAVGGTASVVVTVSPALQPEDEVYATQVVNSVESDLSEMVRVSVLPPTIYIAPAEGDTLVRVQDIDPDATDVTLLVNDLTPFSMAPAGATTIDVPVTGLIAGDLIKAKQTAFGSDSAYGVAETVTVNTTTTLFCDTMETYLDQADFENAPGEVRDRGWWPSSTDPVLTLTTALNATLAGGQSLYCPERASPPCAGTDGWQCNFDCNYPEPDVASFAGTATSPLVWSVSIYDSGSLGKDNVLQTASMYNYRQSGVSNIFVGIGGSYYPPAGGIDTTRYQARVYLGGPGWINLDHPGAPTRSTGWHVFTTVVKDTLVDIYIDGVLAEKNIPRTSRAFDNLYMGSGINPSIDGYFDDYCLHNGKVTFRPVPTQPPPKPVVGTPLYVGEEFVNISDVAQDATRIDVYANGTTTIGFLNLTPPNAETEYDVPVTPLVHLDSIMAKQTGPTGVSAPSDAFEVGIRNGEILVCVGISEVVSGVTHIEWIGATVLDGAPQGKPLSPSNAWQPFTFDPTTDTITGMTGSSGNGVITQATGKLEHLAVAVNSASAERSVGRYRLYVDNVKNGATTITDFEGYAEGDQVLFQEPGYSGTTSETLLYPPDYSGVTDIFGNPGQSEFLSWRWKDTRPQRWIRITTAGTPFLPGPTISLTQPITMDLLLLNECVYKGDLDEDLDIDFADFDAFTDCFTGPGVAAGAACNCADFDDDYAVDLFDFAEFQVSFNP